MPIPEDLVDVVEELRSQFWTLVTAIAKKTPEYPFVRSIWCSDHWRPPEAVKMTSDECCDDVRWCPYPGTSQRNHDHQCSKSLV
jgi:hypothetical protein